MNEPVPDHAAQRDRGELKDVAAGWVVKRDRGLTPQETEELARWLKAHPSHEPALERAARIWDLIDLMPDGFGEENLVLPTKRISWWYVTAGIAAAVALVWSIWAWRLPQAQAVQMAAGELKAHSVTLSDGSVVSLNVGGDVTEHFLPHERRVRLVRGEAHFAVTKNPERPFIVEAGGVEFRAVGTAFNVNLKQDAVELLVTEGRVQVASHEGNAAKTVSSPISSTLPPVTFAQAAETPILGKGQRAIVRFHATDDASRIQITQLEKNEIDQAMAWQHSLINLGGSTLAELAEQFYRRTGKRLVFADPALAEVRIGGRFWSDEAEAFVHVLEENYGLKSETGADGSIVLRRAEATSP